MYIIGIDYGTLSGRALLIDASNGDCLAEAVYAYPHGVIDQHLPHREESLPPDWALQHPQDYLDVLQYTIPQLLQQSGIDKARVMGIGIDFTSSTILPVTADGIPLCFLDEWRDHPHAWVKLWKHHAAEKQAKRIEALAKQQQVTWLARYGGSISSEFFMSKALQICDEDLALYQHADRLIEAGDWLVWQLTNHETRSRAMAGYKALYQDGKFPSTDFLAALNPYFKDVTTAKIGSQFLPIGAKAGELTSDMAKRLGLNPGVAVAVANIDAHASAPALQATEAGIMVLVMGTSTCHIISSEKQINVEGMFGVVQHGIIPNLYGYEAGQSGVGDIFAWFVENMVPKHYYDDAALAGQSIHEYLEAQAAKQAVGEHGLIALDWWNGNRSTLMNSNLSGIIIGLTLATRAPDIYRALIEATAFGTRRIIETYEAHGIEVRVLIAAGGLPQKNQLLRQIYADVTGRDIKIAGTTLSSAVGSAIFAALAAGIYDSVQQASDVMGHYSDVIVSPNPENQAAYQKLYEMYQRLYDYLGHDVPSIMADLKQNRNALLVNK